MKNIFLTGLLAAVCFLPNQAQNIEQLRQMRDLQRMQEKAAISQQHLDAYMQTVSLAKAAKDGEDISVELNETNFPDAAFRSIIAEKYDLDNNGILDDVEIYSVTRLDISGEMTGILGNIPGERGAVKDLTGIENFLNLIALNCTNSSVEEINLSGNPLLYSLECTLNPQLTKVDVTQNPALRELKMSDCSISVPDLSQNPALETLYASRCNLTSVDLSHNAKLYDVALDGNNLTTLDVTNNPALYYLVCGENPLSELDLSGNPILAQLCIEHTHISEINYKEESLGELRCSYSPVKKLDLSPFFEMDWLECAGTELTELNVSVLEELICLLCDSTHITSLDLSANEMLFGDMENDVPEFGDPIIHFFSCNGSYRVVNAQVGGEFWLGSLPGFNPAKASNWKGGTVNGYTLTFNESEVTYEYETDFTGDADGIGQTLTFKLIANGEVANESASRAVPFKAYAGKGVLHVDGTEGLVEIFDLQGRRVLSGNGSEFHLPGQGVYVVRNRNYSVKVLNL